MKAVNAQFVFDHSCAKLGNYCYPETLVNLKFMEIPVFPVKDLQFSLDRDTHPESVLYIATE